MIRVLQVFHGMNSGGAETMIMNLYRHIDRTKVQFDFLVHTTKKCFFDDEIRKLGGNIYYVPYYKVTNGRQYKTALNQFFESHPEIKIVHGHLGSCAHIYLQIAKKYGCYAIAHSHNTKSKGFSLKKILYRIFTYKMRKVADYFFGCSVAAAEYRFGHKNAHSNKCDILKNAIEVEKFAYSVENRKRIRDEFNLHEKFVLGNIGRLTVQKNQGFLIDIFAEVHKKNTNSALLIVGVGELEKSLKEKVKTLGLSDSVIFTGSRGDVPALLSAMDVFVFPSLWEGLGIVVIEAQATGLHTLCSDSVPRDTQITDLVSFISLKQSVENWAEVILKYNKPYARLNMRQIISDAGFDVCSTALWLQNFYLGISEKK